jgi:non-heme chloroperoxidase
VVALHSTAEAPPRRASRGAVPIAAAAVAASPRAGHIALDPAGGRARKAFSETDQTDDLKKIDVPTLIPHGDADQIVPIADSAMLSAKLVRQAELKVIPGAPHGMCTTHKDVINEALIAFFRG